VTDQSQSLTITEFEHVAVGPSVVLLRVNGRSQDPRPSPDWRPTLMANHTGEPERFAALPSPPDAEGVLRAAYSVPAALIAPETRFWLELADRKIVDLGAPALGTPRRHAGAAAAAENRKLSATLEDLEIWRGELERRLADITTELAKTRVRLTEAHAAAEIDALVTRAEADALEQAAHELTAAAQSARSAA
jgi:hypothetical protein